MEDPKKELISLMEHLIRYRTVSSDVPELNACADFIESAFRGTGVIVKRYSHATKPSIVLLLEDTKQPEVMLMAHLDVVEAKPEQFRPTLQGDTLYGRGAADDKSAVAIIMLLMKHFAGHRLKPSIGAMITSDEETGGRSGARFLVQDKGYRPKFVIALDGGANLGIVIQEKGYMQIKVVAKGKSAHGSTPWNGINAIELLIKAYYDLRKAFARVTLARTWRLTINLGKIKGGETINQVPDYAEMWLDVRYTSLAERSRFIERLRRLRDISFTIEDEGSIVCTSESNRYVISLQAAARKVLNHGVDLMREHGASDARYFADMKIPAVLMVPESGNSHGDREYVSVASVQKLFRLLMIFIENSARKIDHAKGL